MATIEINGHVVDTASQLEGGQQYAADASQSNFILIHCPTRLKNAQYDILDQLGVLILEYVPDCTYLCRYEPADLEPIRLLPFVIFANVYHQDLVIEPVFEAKAMEILGLRGPTLRLATEDLSKQQQPEKSNMGGPAVVAPAESVSEQPQLHEVCIRLHKQLTRSHEEVQDYLADLIHVEPDRIYRNDYFLYTYLNTKDLETVARVDDVKSIDEAGKREFLNDQARVVLNCFDSSWEGEKQWGLTGGVYNARAEIVTVSDTGFDLGDIAEVHPAFAPWCVVDIVEFIKNSGKNDTTCHGTHVAGSVAGTKGTAPEANLIIQKVSDATGAFPQFFDFFLGGPNGIFGEPYARTDYISRIHTCSWGTTDTGRGGTSNYAPSTQAVDKIVNERKDLLILFAAGNNGIKDPPVINQITEEASAKNCLSVGNCESKRPYDKDNQGRLKYSAAGTTFGDPSNVSVFSSRGPARSGRPKPDVVAPGVGIYSARSRDPNVRYPKGLPDGQPNDFNVHGISTDPYWMFMSGTSMSTPLVAGCAAVLRKVLRSRNTDPSYSPSAALMKALIINNTIDSYKKNTRGPLIGPPPDVAQGYGRVNISGSIRNVVDWVNGMYHEGGPLVQEPDPFSHPPDPPLPQGVEGSKTFSLQILKAPVDPDPTIKPGTPLKLILTVTLVWTDPAGPGLVNTLELSVINSAGVHSFQSAVTNNVQKLVWTDIPPGDTQITVTCTAITKSPTNTSQDFALAAYVSYAPTKLQEQEYNKWNEMASSDFALMKAKDLDAWNPRG